MNSVSGQNCLVTCTQWLAFQNEITMLNANNFNESIDFAYNASSLRLLTCEINVIQDHGIKLPVVWYRRLFPLSVFKYAKLKDKKKRKVFLNNERCLSQIDISKCT